MDQHSVAEAKQECVPATAVGMNTDQGEISIVLDQTVNALDIRRRLHEGETITITLSVRP